jgi:hypothetical protein
MDDLSRIYHGRVGPRQSFRESGRISAIAQRSALPVYSHRGQQQDSTEFKLNTPESEPQYIDAETDETFSTARPHLNQKSVPEAQNIRMQRPPDRFRERYNKGRSPPSFNHDSSRFVATPSPAPLTPEPYFTHEHGAQKLQSQQEAWYSSSNQYPIPHVPINIERGHSQVPSATSNRPIASSWGSGMPGLNSQAIAETYSEDEYDSSDDKTIISRQLISESNAQQPNLVRQASIGKISKPTLTNIRGSDRQPSKYSWLKSADTLPSATNPTDTKQVPVLPGTEPGTAFDEHGALIGNGFYDSATDASFINMPQPIRGKPGLIKQGYREGRKSPRPFLTSTFKSRHEKLLGIDKPTGPIPITPEPEELAEEDITELPAKPARVINRPRSSTRVSTTSLPELIRRATRLAAALEKGRPASRHNKAFPIDDPNLAEEKVPKAADEFSNMLASFPPPSGVKPVKARSYSIVDGEGMMDKQLLATSKHTPASRSRYRRASCFNLPRWAIILIVLAVMAIIAAAIVIPLQLVVLSKHSSTTLSSTTNATCNLTCENGGILSNNSCSCTCLSGFSGHICSDYGNSGCQSSDLGATEGGVANATVGTAIPRLLESAEANYSVPLNSVVILSVFAANNLSCTVENSLVTFDGVFNPKTRRRSIDRREKPSPTKVSVSSTATSSSLFPGATSNIAFPSSAIDFARVSVLYILQSSDLATAITAQSKLQASILEGDYPQTVTIGQDGFQVNFTDWSIVLQNGTVVGGQLTASSPSAKLFTF